MTVVNSSTLLKSARPVLTGTEPHFPSGPARAALGRSSLAGAMSAVAVGPAGTATGPRSGSSSGSDSGTAGSATAGSGSVVLPSWVSRSSPASSANSDSNPPAASDLARPPTT